MATPRNAVAQAVRTLERAHRSFQVGAIRKLYPQLQGEHLGNAVGREVMRDHSYVDNMRKRLRAAGGSPGALAKERRYLAQHITQAGWRMRSEADIATLKQAGEPGAVWVMDPTKLNHTADCQAMAHRYWPWSVLDKVNPANRHAGCGCRLVSRADATAQGVTYVNGRQGPAVKAEMATAQALTEARRPRKVKLRRAAWTTIMPRFRAGLLWHPDEHPRNASGEFIDKGGNAVSAKGKQGRDKFVVVTGKLPHPDDVDPAYRKGSKVIDYGPHATAMHDKLKEMQGYIAAGDYARYQTAFEELMKMAEKLPSDPIPSDKERAKQGKPPLPPKVRERMETNQSIRTDTIKTLRIMHQAVMNPLGAPTAIGAKREKVRVSQSGTELQRDLAYGYATGHAPDPWAPLLLDPWTKDGTFAWHLPGDMEGTRLIAHNYNKLYGGRQLEVKSVRADGSVVPYEPGSPSYFIQTRPGLDRPMARAIFRTIEANRTHLRRLRASAPDDYLNDDRALEVGPDEREFPGGGVLTAQPNVKDHQIGIAGELAMNDFYEALKEQGFIDPDDDNPPILPSAEGDLYAPLDVLMDGIGAETKSIDARTIELGQTVRSPTMSTEDQKRHRQAVTEGRAEEKRGTTGRHAPLIKDLTPKAKELFDKMAGTQTLLGGEQATGLRPGAAIMLVDNQTNVVHGFWVEYPNEETAFSSIPRLPQSLTRALATGEFKYPDGETEAMAPGITVITKTKEKPGVEAEERPVTYVGTWQLRYNATVSRDVGRELSPADIQKRLMDPPKAVDRDISGQLGAPTGRRVAEPEPTRREVRAAKSKDKPKTLVERIADEHIDLIHSMNADGYSQADVARKIGGDLVDENGKPKQYLMSKIYKHLDISTGRGKRTDRTRPRGGGAEHQHRGGTQRASKAKPKKPL